jgi:hypothetical protein
MVRLPRPDFGQEGAGGMYTERGSSHSGTFLEARVTRHERRAKRADNVQSATYWSATTNASNATNAWDVNFNNGNVDTNDKSNTNLAWCVRGGAW